MAILNKDDFMKKIKDRIGDDESDEAISFIEDMTDTFNDFENRTKDTTDWKTKFEENDANWKKKYKERFFSGDSGDSGSEQRESKPDIKPKEKEESEEEKKAKNVSFDDLFK